MFKIKEILQQIKNIDKNEVASTITSTISTVKNKIFSIFNMPKDEATDTEINKTNEEINEEEVNKWKKKVSKERKKENNSSKHNSSTNNSPIKDNGEIKSEPKKEGKEVKKTPKSDRLYTNELAKIKLQEKRVFDYLDNSGNIKKAKNKLEEYKEIDDKGKLLIENINKQLDYNNNKKVELENKISKIKDEIKKENRTFTKEEMQKAIKEGKYNKLITNYDKKIKETEDKFVHEKDLEQKNKLDILLKVWISSKKNFEKAKLEVEEENERMITQLKQKRREYVNYINENKEHYKRVKNDMKIYQNIQKLLEAIKNIDKKISFLSKPI